MKRPRLKTEPLLLALAALIRLANPMSGAAGGEEEASSGRLSVFVSITPQAYFVERVGGDRVEVEVLVQPGQSPHTFEPTPKQMARLAEADLYFRIGIEFENALMPRIENTMGELEVVDCRRGIQLREMEMHGLEGEEHGAHEEDKTGHEHTGKDPHIWLDPILVERQARTIRDALCRLDPHGREVYEEGYHRFAEDLEELDRRIARTLAPVKGRQMFVFHPAFGYFAGRYGLRQVAVEIAGREPSARELARLIEEARERGVRVIFVQPQFSRDEARAIAEAIDGAVVPIDPLARDYLANLERMARKVEEALH